VTDDERVRTLNTLLGVSAASSYDEVRRAFRFASRANHPDRNASDPFAEQRFKAINAGWQLVNTAERLEAQRTKAKGTSSGGATRHESRPPPRPGSPRTGSKVVVHGYTQWFLINPKVQIYWNGDRVGAVEKMVSMSFDVGGDGEVSFKSSMRSAASVHVQAGRVTTIKISCDRVSEKLVPHETGPRRR